MNISNFRGNRIIAKPLIKIYVMCVCFILYDYMSRIGMESGTLPMR